MELLQIIIQRGIFNKSPPLLFYLIHDNTKKRPSVIEMELWMFIRKEEATHQIKICPLTGKIQGSYPEDYMGGRNDE